MKIDKLIELLGAEDSVVITNKETIDSFFDGTEGIGGGFAIFDMPTRRSAKAICKNGTNIYFIEQEDLEDIKFKTI